MSETAHRAIRMALASLLAVALVAQLAVGMSRSGLTVVNFFSYFTVLSNTAAVVLLVLLAGRPRWDASTRFAAFRGAVTVYMSVTGLVYALLLAPIAADVGVMEPWIDWSIHVVGPIAILADWVYDPPTNGVAAKSIWAWLVFPAFYLVYSLVRGPLADWYPYPFLDPGERGYGTVAFWSAIVLAVILTFSYAYYWWANRTVQRRRAAA